MHLDWLHSANLTHATQSRPANVRLLLTAAMSMLALVLMLQVSASATLLFGSAMASVTFVAPAVLVRAQAHKKCVEVSSMCTTN